MAIDTRDKRASALMLGVLPNPDGAALNQGDKMQSVRLYRGIAITVVLDIPAVCFDLPERSPMFDLPERVPAFDLVQR